MMYKFPLQRLLDLKSKKEQEMARQLAGARLTANAERDTRDTLAATHAEAHRHTATAAGGASEASDAGNAGGAGEASGSATRPTVGQLVSMSYALEQLGERVTAADERTLAADKVVSERHDELSTVVRERQVLDRLRGKRLDAHKSDENARDRQLMDAIALVRFTSTAAGRRKES